MARGSTHVALSTEAESTTSTEAASAAFFLPRLPRGFYSVPSLLRTAQLRNFILRSYRVAPCTQLHATGSTVQLITQHLATGNAWYTTPRASHDATKFFNRGIP